MPSKEMNDVLAVEELVHEIKENLRLKARPSHNHGRNSRPSPYHIPCRSWNDPTHQQQQQQITTCNNSNCINNPNNYTIINNCSNNSSSCSDINSTMIGCVTTTSTTTTNNLINNINYNNSIHNHNHHNSNLTYCNNCSKNLNTNHSNQHHKKPQQKNNDDIDDPYELLQVLLKNQNLVKEAVRRLQLSNLSPKQRYFYESDGDDGSRSPIYGRVCQLEL